MPLIVYDWGTQPGYLLFHLFPNAIVIQGNHTDDPNALCERMPHFPLAGSTFILHICLSNTKKWFSDRDSLVQSLADQGISLVNSRLVDVTKRNISRVNSECQFATLDLASTAEPDEMTIAKTNYNYGGYSERNISDQAKLYLGIGSQLSPIKRFDEYLVAPAREIPRHFWNDESIVIQKYVSNRWDIYLRVYIAGSQMVISAAKNPERVKKMSPGLPRKNWLLRRDTNSDGFCKTISSMSWQFCDRIGLEFGALDIVFDDSLNPYIIDVNPTPGWGDEKQTGVLEHLRKGVHVAGNTH